MRLDNDSQYHLLLADAAVHFERNLTSYSIKWANLA